MIITDSHWLSVPHLLDSSVHMMNSELVPVVFCEIHYHLFVLQKQLKETQKTFQQRIQQREKDLQQLREAEASHKVSLEKKISLSQSQFRLTEAWITVCPNSALHRQQWRTVRGSLLSSSAPLREAALSWYGWSEIRKSKQWVELKDDWSDWSRRSMIWGGETLSWSSFHTHRITSSSCRYTDLQPKSEKVWDSRKTQIKKE